MRTGSRRARWSGGMDGGLGVTAPQSGRGGCGQPADRGISQQVGLVWEGAGQVGSAGSLSCPPLVPALQPPLFSTTRSFLLSRVLLPAAASGLQLSWKNPLPAALPPSLPPRRTCSPASWTPLLCARSLPWAFSFQSSPFSAIDETLEGMVIFIICTLV